MINGCDVKYVPPQGVRRVTSDDYNQSCVSYRIVSYLAIQYDTPGNDTLRYDTNDTNDTYLSTFSGVSYRMVPLAGRITMAFGRIASYRIAYFLFFKAKL